MKQVFLIAVSPILCGCGAQPSNRPTHHQLAQFCGVDVGALTEAKAQLVKTASRDFHKVGTCNLIKGEDGKIKLVEMRRAPESQN